MLIPSWYLHVCGWAVALAALAGVLAGMAWIVGIAAIWVQRVWVCERVVFDALGREYRRRAAMEGAPLNTRELRKGFAVVLFVAWVAGYAVGGWPGVACAVVACSTAFLACVGRAK